MSSDGWSTAVNKRSRNKRSKQERNLEEEESIKTPNPDLLDPIFQKQQDEEEETEKTPEESLDIQDNLEDGFVTVTHKRRKKKGAAATPPKATPGSEPAANQGKRKRKRKTKKKKSQRVLAEEDEEQDKMRARNDLIKGVPIEYYSSLADAWIKATVVSSYQEEVTIEYYSPTDPDMPRIGKFSRFGDEIRPVKDKTTGFHYPLPKEEEEIVVKKRKEQPKKKTKKKKKHQAKKVQTEEEIFTLIDELLKNRGPIMGMTEIANSIKENLSGGSWGKRYKSQYGGMKKFLSAQDTFEVFEDEGQIMVRRLEPEPEVMEETKERKITEKKHTSSGSGPLLYLFIIVILPVIVAFVLLKDDERREQACGKLSKLLGEHMKHLDAICQREKWYF